MKKYIFLLAFILFSITASGQLCNYEYRLTSAIPIGIYKSPFSYTDTCYTGDYPDSFQGEYMLPPLSGSRDVFYKLTLTRSLDIKVLLSWKQSPLLLVHLLDSSGKLIQGSVSGATFSLLPGNYYFVIEAEPSFISDVILPVDTIKVNIEGTTRTEGEDFFHPFELGTYTSDFQLTPTVYPMDEYRMDYYRTGVSQYDEYLHDAVFRIKFDCPMKVSMDNSGTVYVPNKNHYESKLLNAYGDTLIVRRDGYSNNRIVSIPAGVYYLYVWANIKSFASSNKIIVNLNGTVDKNGSESGEIGIPDTIPGYPHMINLIPRQETSDFSNPNKIEYFQEILYYDHFGKLEERIQSGFTPSRKDLLTLTEYDGFGRQTYQWLPIPVDSVSCCYVHPAYLKRAARLSPIYKFDPYPYSRFQYEQSSIGRKLTENQPGVDWHSLGHLNRKEYLTNTNYAGNDYMVYLYRCKTDSLICEKRYSNNSLYVIRTTDEDGNISYEFKDKANGKVLLSRQMNGEEAHDTYYVYDGNGNLCFVLPPMAADALAAAGTYTVSNDALQKYAYLYRYDGYNRCIYKKLPGADPVYTVYDAADRPVFTQDGQQRERGEWTFNISDSFNRVVLTGTCHNVLDYTQNPLDTLVVKATWANTTNALKGYTVTGVTLTTPTVQQANYYDSYEFLGLNGIPNNSTTAYAAAEGYGERFNGGCRGQQTGVWQANLNGGQALYSVNYYDDRYRMVQQKGINGNGEQTATYTHFSFTGQPLKIKRVQGANTEVLDYTYDHADRLLTTVYRLNNDPAVTLADNVYDEIGRLITDRRNGNANLKTDYAYNLRSWVKSITSPLFTQTLYYQENIAGNTPCYNGNISRMQWRTSKDAQERGYRFTYDNLSRMKNAVYGEGSTLAANVERFNEQVTAYDKMGNILGLLRYGQTGASTYGLIDNLNLTYNGNQLQAVSDNATNSVYGNGMEFKDGATATTEYEYDKNGNLTKDLNKNISRIEYNCLNLPSRVTFANGDSIRYEYAADGTKLRTVYTIGGTTTTTDYCGNAVYENGVLKMLLNDAGYVSFPDKKFHFYIKDHQGNVRVVADAEGNVEEVNDYYPFGGLMSNATGNEFQKYKYNGKELDRKAGLNLYDYGARFYDPAIGRWHVVDPMSEVKHAIGTYAYCLNNPMNLIDPTGCLESTHTDSLGNVVKVYNDGDMGVYRHNTDKEGTERELAELYSENNTSADGEYMGKTRYWNEFLTDGGKIYPGTRILFGTSWDRWIEALNAEAAQAGLSVTAFRSLPGKAYDIKTSPILSPDGPYTGRLLGGEYVSARSAGNFLAGMNGATGTIGGQYISLELYMRMAGALHSMQNGTNPFVSPYYGEIESAGRWIVSGFNYGVYKVVSKNWIAQ